MPARALVGTRPDPLRAGTVPARASVGTLPGQGGGGPGVSGYALDLENPSLTLRNTKIEYLKRD